MICGESWKLIFFLTDFRVRVSVYMVVDFLTPMKLIAVVKYVSCMQVLWLVISSDHLSSKLHSRVKSKNLSLIIKWFTDLVPLPLASLQTPAPTTFPQIVDAPSTCFHLGTWTQCCTAVAPRCHSTFLPSSWRRTHLSLLNSIVVWFSEMKLNVQFMFISHLFF